MSDNRSCQHTIQHTMKRQAMSFLTFIAALLITAACSDELFIDEPTTFTVEGETVEVDLDLSVSDLSIEMTTRSAADDTPGERRINDIWVFQYDQSTKSIIQANYYTIDDQDELDDLTTVHAQLNDNSQKPCIIYVVANTGDDSWAKNATETSSGFYTLDELKEKTIPNPAPIRIDGSTDDEGSKSEDNLSIPMGGCVGEDGDIVIKGAQKERITVPVTRMFAKLYVMVNLKSNEYEGSMTSMMIDNIPDFCTVGTVYKNDKWYYPTSSAGSVFDVSRTFTPDENTTETDNDDGTKSYGPFVLYVPENLQGTSTTEAIKITPYLEAKIDIADGNNSKATITSRPSYTAYPGTWNAEMDAGSSTTKSGENTDIKRNNIYDITLTIGLSANDLVTPSANCLIAEPGGTIAFYPYVRDEQPSDELKAESNYASTLEARYDFTTYLNSSYAANDGKKIKSVKIIWQYPQGFIGDNSNFNLVTIDPGPDDTETYGTGLSDDEKSVIEYHRKIYVQTKSAGNALIAAYDGEDGTGNILWSWHIWAPNNGVDPEAGAIEYYHYKWNTDGIQTDSYEPGPLVMNLNLGALAEKPTSEGVFTHDTYGTLYQWGRKDPFPPAGASPQHGSSPATLEAMTPCYDNSNELIDVSDNNGSLTATSNKSVFWTDAPSNVPGGTLSKTDDDDIIKQTILHPTMFVTSVENPNAGMTWRSASDFYNEGDWLPNGDDFLWGGGHTNESSEYHVYSQVSGSESGLYNSNYPIDAYLEDDFGPEKTIFDPCPYGWRVTNGDLWLGFTDDGLNWMSSQNVNDANIVEKATKPSEYQQITYQQSGHTYYMQGWHGSLGSKTSFFPTQGTRAPSGSYNPNGSCGNYNNATVDKPMKFSNNTGTIRRVDIIHVHSEENGQNYAFPFVRESYFFNKTVACPIRCVRDSK